MPNTKRGYITAGEYTTLTDRSISETVEWERQTNTAERLVDLAVGPYAPFYTSDSITITSATSNTFISSALSENKDDYYNNLRVQIKEGTGSGYSGFITDYVGATTTCTVSGNFNTTPDTNSTIIVDQLAVFPRIQDFDADSRPIIPEAVTEATAFIMEYWDVKGGADGFNASEFNITGGKAREKIGNYEVEYDLSQENDMRKLIGNKAQMVLQKAGLFQRHGRIL